MQWVRGKEKSRMTLRMQIWKAGWLIVSLTIAKAGREAGWRKDDELHFGCTGFEVL